MFTRTVSIGHKAAKKKYEIEVATDLLGSLGVRASAWSGSSAKKAVIVSNQTVFSLYGKRIEASLRKSGKEVSVWLMRDGERYKNSHSLEHALKHFFENRLSRDDVVIALGGGVVGDLAGFAAAVYLRGIRFFQIPTTLLAMIDSSVGGKTGINTEFGKNLIGAFHQPAGVLIDVGVLRTLPRRELTAGFCEAVKHGALSGEKLFEETAAFLTDFPVSKGFQVNDRSVSLIADQVAFKASVVRQDETETTGRMDAKSRKILNFGHTFGHALEKVTNYRRFRHGEAVGYGMLVAGELSKNLDLLSQDELKSLNDVLHRAGRLPSVAGIDPESIFEALKFDKKVSGGKLNWILLNGIGKPVIISESDIPRKALVGAVKAILKN
ncbi:MAG TPA: 3-dehydroquinate synthase [Pyrinomonadaceae bacterium]|nr:3-dehydroquinate synthase [Pyrinomonadaceae bacterium]